ncbi:MAG: hypothetical protein ACK5PB_12810 [Pirellula sp.]|jgi:hypothetical protein
MSVATILDRLRRKKNDSISDVWLEHKKTVLLPLARNEEVDLDAVEQAMADLGWDEAALQKEVSVLQRRLATVEQIKTAESNSRRLQTIEREIEKLDREFALVREQFTAKMTPLLSQRNVLSSGPAVTVMETELRASVQSPRLRQALAENVENRKAISPRISELREQLHRNASGGFATIRWRVDKCLDDIAAIEKPKSTIGKIGDALLAYTTNDKTSVERNEKLVALRLQLERLQETESRMAAELDELERQQAVLLDEERRLHSLCLEP